MKIRNLILLFFIIVFFSVSYKTLSSNLVFNSQEKTELESDSIPDGYTVLGEAMGDLDKDKIPEKVIAFDSKEESEMGTVRHIYIYKKKNEKWELWHKSTGAILPSDSGGAMGDPFEKISIERGAIVIYHFGGSRQKWNYTHRFRFQNSKWELIGASIYYGAPCEYFESFDYNTSVGKIIYEKIIEKCEDDDNLEEQKINKTFYQKLKKLPEMDDFKPGENKIKLTEINRSFYY